MVASVEQPQTWQFINMVLAASDQSLFVMILLASCMLQWPAIDCQTTLIVTGDIGKKRLDLWTEQAWKSEGQEIPGATDGTPAAPVRRPGGQ